MYRNDVTFFRLRFFAIFRLLAANTFTAALIGGSP